MSPRLRQLINASPCTIVELTTPFLPIRFPSYSPRSTSHRPLSAHARYPVPRARLREAHIIDVPNKHLHTGRTPVAHRLSCGPRFSFAHKIKSGRKYDLHASREQILTQQKQTFGITTTSCCELPMCLVQCLLPHTSMSLLLGGDFPSAPDCYGP
jgi:hypothetical protein